MCADVKMDFEVRDESVYFDNAATTEVDDEVVEAMQPYLEERFGNQATPYDIGQEADEAVDEAREKVAGLLDCAPEEVFFTSGGTEANNWAVKGTKGGHESVVISAVEHPSVLKPAEWAYGTGAGRLCKAPVDKNGLVDIGFIKKKLKAKNLGLVTIQYANNETGTLQSVREIAALCKANGVPFHTDACQAVGKVPVSMEDDGFDMATVSAHKIHGPMGIGALCVKKGTELEPLLHGGGHQNGMRSGTLPTALIVGLGAAADLARTGVETEIPRVKKMVNELVKDLKSGCDVVINGHPENRLPNIVSATFKDVEGALLCGILEAQYGFCVSTGAACSTRERGSHVLEAMGRTRQEACSTIRVSLCKSNTIQQVKVFVGQVQGALMEAQKRLCL
jgi:cysteine desulfurase